MLPNPPQPEDDASEPGGPPLEDDAAARQIAHVTGMSPEAAAAFAAYHSGRFTRAR